MEFFKLNGRKGKTNIHKYVIDWNDDSLSIFQWKVKRFFYPFWRANVVLEEFPLAGSRLRLDFLNLTDGIGVECDGGQHDDPLHYYNFKSPSKFLEQVRRDVQKDDWCRKNGIQLVRIKESEADQISQEWFREKYNIDL